MESTHKLNQSTWKHKDIENSFSRFFSIKPTKTRELEVWDNTVNQEDVKSSHIIVMLVSATYCHVILSCHKVQKDYNLPGPLTNGGEVNTLGCFSLYSLPVSQGLWCKWLMCTAVFLRLMTVCHEVLALGQ